MSRSNGCETARDAGQTASRPIERRAITAASALACASLLSCVSCGGTQSSQVPDAAVDATGPGPLSVGPLDSDPCLTSQQFEFESIANFSANLPALAMPGAVYVSYDGSGRLYQQECILGASCFENVPEQDIYSTLCANCLIDPASGGCGGCTCTSGYNPVPPEIPPIPRCGTDRAALHLHADTADGGGLADWGMNVGIDLRQNCSGTMDGDAGPRNVTDGGPSPTPCYFDARDWTGISFWALLGSEPSGTTALATLADRSTASALGGVYPDNNQTNPVCGNKPCAATMPPDNHCLSTTVPLCLCDPFGQGVGLVHQWAFYAIPFEDLRQKGYGTPQPQLDLAHILNFTLGLGKGNWDVWIDDVAFYRPKSQ
jgi:hypothetical protein